MVENGCKANLLKHNSLQYNIIRRKLVFHFPRKIILFSALFDFVLLILDFYTFFIGTPINRLPIMAKSVLDLYELYNLVIARGGLVDVINKKLWQEIIKGLHLPSSITSAAFTLRTQ